MADEHFDAVVVGSGFGGGVTACRLAEAGQRVLVLERGNRFGPGDFPRSPRGLKDNFWEPADGLHGMFDLWSFEGLEALVGSGLGGGSLIYANVLIRKDPKWFVREEPGPGYEHWPVTYEDLEEHYEQAERMLGATPYPLEHPPYDSTSKTVAYRRAAEETGRGDDWFLPNLAVTFAPRDGADPVVGEPIDEPPNLHGRTRQTCRLVGECDVGCNFGAKNSIDYTYLTEAWRAGAEIRTLCDVRGFEFQDDRGRYAVHYHERDPEAEPRPTRELPRRIVTADRLVLGAGTLGSTYLMLRNRAALPSLPQLGSRFCGNGDLLTFAVRCSQTGEEGKRMPRYVDPGYGPVITSAIRVGDALDDGDGDGGERGFYLEDAGFPEFANWMLQATEMPKGLVRQAPGVAMSFIRRMLRRDYDTSMGAEVSAFFGDCGLSAGVLPLLGMGRDVPDGQMRLTGDDPDRQRLQVDWRKRGRSSAYFERVQQVSREISDRLGASFMDNLLWHLSRVITVHPLGGCPMGYSAEDGVVDTYGEVFGSPGLHVVDGAALPGPVGPNPSLTIAAFAERCARAVVEGQTQELRRPSAARSASGATTAPGGPPLPEADPIEPDERHRGVAVSFTEEMKGFLAFGEEDFDRGYDEGERSDTRFMFHLTITADDLDRFAVDPKHLGRAEGWVRCEALGGRLPVTRGLFNLFVKVEGSKRDKRMLYRLHFTDANDHPLTMTGFKVVEDGAGIDNVWTDTSTLSTRLLKGHVEEGEDDAAETLASGRLRIEPLDFARQLTTFRTDPAGRVDAVARFGALFAGELWETYGPGAERKDGE